MRHGAIEINKKEAYNKKANSYYRNIEINEDKKKNAEHDEADETLLFIEF